MTYLLILAWVISGTIIWVRLVIKDKFLAVWMVLVFPIFFSFGPALALMHLAESRMVQRFFTYEIWRRK